MIGILIWFLCGIVACMIGAGKGEGCLSFIVGFLLGPFGILIAIFSKGDRETCPYCKELVHKDAIVCKHCGRNLKPPTSAKSWRDPVDEWDRKQAREQAAARQRPAAADEKNPCPHCGALIKVNGLKAGKYVCPTCKGQIEIE